MRMKWNMVSAKGLGGRLLPAGKARRAAVPALLLLLLLCLPVGMGGNGRVPVIGWAEALVNDACLAQLQRAQDAYLVTVALDSAISVARSAEASASVLGVGGSVAPGESLAPMHDSVKTLSDVLTNAILLLMVEKQAMGVLSWLCLKCLLPLGLASFLLGLFVRRGRRRLAQAGALLCKGGLALWLLLPVAAALNTVVDSRYLTPRYEAHVTRVKQEIAAIFHLPEEALGGSTSLGQTAIMAMADLAPGEGNGVVGKLRELVGRVKNVALKPGDLISLLMLLFSQIAVTAYVIPGVVLLIFLGLWFIILRAPSGAETGGAPSGRDVPAPLEEAR